LSNPHADKTSPDSIDGAYLSLDATTGELLSYHSAVSVSHQPRVFSREIAIQRADAFIKELYGDEAGLYRTSANVNSVWINKIDGKDVGGASITASYSPLINGVPYVGRTIRVTVDAWGKIIAFSQYDRTELDHSVFVHPDKAVLTPATAKDVLERGITMELVYLPTWSQMNNSGKTMLVYLVKAGPVGINAVSGKNFYWFGSNNLEEQLITINGQGKKLVAQDRREANMLLQTHFGENLRGVTKEGEKRWGNGEVSYYWSKDFPGDEFGIKYELTTNSSGEVLNFVTLGDYWQNLPVNPTAVKFSRDEARIIAQEFMETVSPLGTRTMLMSTNAPFRAPSWVEPSVRDLLQVADNRFLNLYFFHTHQGIPIEGTDISVQVNRETGKVNNYYRSDFTLPTDWPDPKLAISPEKAKREYLDNTPLQMAYIWPKLFEYSAPAPSLFYIAGNEENWEYIDAITGAMVRFYR